MLTELCQELKNWFIRSDSDKHIGTFEIRDGILIPSLDLKPNQYYRISGSIFNDGVHKVGDVLTNETFTGSVWAMAVPKEVVELSETIDAWKTKYAATVNTPYTNESFGGYSYTKSPGSANWQSVFSKEMNKWRKIL